VTLESPGRRVFKQFIVSVVAVHAIAIALYYALDIPHSTPGMQRYFAWAWMAVTLGVVFAGLQRLKRARRGR